MYIKPRVKSQSKVNLTIKENEAKGKQLVNFKTANLGDKLLQRNFISLALLQGFLQTKIESAKKPGWFGKSKDTAWEQKFYVLTSIGLIVMEAPNSKEIDFYPYNEFRIKEVKESKYDRKNCFELIPVISSKAIEELMSVMQAPNAESCATWIYAIENQ